MRLTVVDGLVCQYGRVRHATAFHVAADPAASTASEAIAGEMHRVRQMIQALCRDEDQQLACSEQVKVACQLALSRRLGLAAQRLQAEQRRYLSSTPTWLTLGMQRNAGRATDSDSDTSWASPPQQQALCRFVHDGEMHGRRLAELSALAESVRSVAALSRDMHLLVARQGSLVDRVDYHLENASSRTREAVRVISQRADVDELDRRKLVLLLLAMMIVVLSAAIIFKPHK